LSYSSKDLRAWQDAKALAVQTYRVTEAFPKSELFGLTSQMRRADVSIASNIAEGQGRSSKPDFTRFLRISRGSLLELETQLEIVQDEFFLSEKFSIGLFVVKKIVDWMLHQRHPHVDDVLEKDWILD